MRRGLARRGLLVAAGGLLAAPAIVRAQGQSSGVALVIGNSRYLSEAPLPNVKRDAPDIARRFQAFGLQSELLQDQGRDAMLRAIEKFLAAAKGANLAAVYFAGHGVQEKDTYLVPVDADLNTLSSLKDLVPVPLLWNGMRAASHSLVVLDSCRNNPADGRAQRTTADQSRGEGALGRVSDAAPRNALIMFSTAPGRIALDGPAGENSPFAAALLRQFEGPSVDLQALPARVRRDLLIATQGRQVLWDGNSYREPFVLNRSSQATAGITPTPSGKSGWSADPSKIVELANAYAYAQQNGLQLPPGLIAHRPPADSRHRQKVGAFRFPRFREPCVVVVLSVEEQQTAEVVMVSRRVPGGQPFWTFVRGTLSDDSLELARQDGGTRHVLRWSDGNSGSATMFPAKVDGGPPYSSRFERLDG